MVLATKMKVGLLAASAVGVVALGSTTFVSAEGNHSDSMVDRISTKFNLNKQEVQAVFDEEKAARQAERQAEQSKQLQAAVDAGKITAEQKSLIENKMKENQAAREAEITALKEWASTNNIDLKYVIGGKHRGNTSSNRLDAAVASGAITADQKTAIEAKQAELQKARDERKAAMQTWAESNNISLEQMHIGGHMNKGGNDRN